MKDGAEVLVKGFEEGFTMTNPHEQSGRGFALN